MGGQPTGLFHLVSRGAGRNTFKGFVSDLTGAVAGTHDIPLGHKNTTAQRRLGCGAGGMQQAKTMSHLVSDGRVFLRPNGQPSDVPGAGLAVQGALTPAAPGTAV